MSPLYEWKCNCGKELDMVVKHSDMKNPVSCPDCGKVMELQFPTNTSVIYKTIGFHCKDYGVRERQANGKRFGRPIRVKKGRGF